MTIIATTRTKNEAKNIDRFCQCYEWADKVLVADGGSEDNTVALAKQYKNVSVRIFDEKIHRNGFWHNPQGKQINFIIDWAVSEGAEWIIFDDADCVPTRDLQLALREIMYVSAPGAIMLYRLYVWGQNHYFPRMNKAGQSLYAWHVSLPVRACEADPLAHRIGGWNQSDELRLEKPLCCLHYFFPDEETVARKKAHREGIGKVKFQPHPLDSFGPLEILPEWAVIK